MRPSPSVDIIIVNWNTGDQLRDCLRSLGACAGEHGGSGRVIVVDNASSDASAEYIPDIPLPVRVLFNRHNRGFAAACNQGAAGGSSDYILLLNPDTVLSPGALRHPIEFLERAENASVGICGVRLVDEQGRMSLSCARFPSARALLGTLTGLSRVLPRLFPPHHLTASELEESRSVDQIMGAFFMVRRSLFEALGGLDERFFLYYEEVDFALRARNAGFSSFYLKGASVYHRRGGSSDGAGALRLFHSLRSRITYFRIHASRAELAAVMLLSFTLEPIARLVRALGLGSLREAREVLHAYRLLLEPLVRPRGRALPGAAAASPLAPATHAREVAAWPPLHAPSRGMTSPSGPAI